LGEEFPGEPDCALFEVVAERKIPEHLEERVVVRGEAYPLKIRGAEAFLACGNPGIAGRNLSPKDVLELDHPRGGEKKGGIVGN
jgi:hypothetical protein